MAVLINFGGGVYKPLETPVKAIVSGEIAETPALLNARLSVAAKAFVVKCGHSKPLPKPDLNQPGRWRVGHLMSLYGLSHSSVYAHLRKQLLPPPDGYIANRPYWRSETLRADLAS